MEFYFNNVYRSRSIYSILPREWRHPSVTPSWRWILRTNLESRNIIKPRTIDLTRGSLKSKEHGIEGR